MAPKPPNPQIPPLKTLLCGGVGGGGGAALGSLFYYQGLGFRGWGRSGCGDQGSGLGFRVCLGFRFGVWGL